eukprot:CAMPEP_0170484084 /NCGR_PEP_ID=MMETSP0208-20121228/3635_1 /TAXON_ID=197538 /ORGANISM="Strombidium inclinatum, Strain S3" /LENGTH=137 /DNA_ID=CAMNT_0010757337 /DNA_START=280 /DNA_END=689 /DNA_ORIENTATION=+
MIDVHKRERTPARFQGPVSFLLEVLDAPAQAHDGETWSEVDDASVHVGFEMRSKHRKGVPVFFEERDGVVVAREVIQGGSILLKVVHEQGLELALSHREVLRLLFSVVRQVGDVTRDEEIVVYVAVVGGLVPLLEET